MMGPALAEPPGPDARHAQGSHGADLGEGHLEELVDEDRIEVVIVRARAVPGMEERDTLVEVVDDGRVEAEEHPGHGPRQLEGLPVCVAVVVMENVMTPVGRGDRRQAVEIRLPLEVAVEPIHHLVSAVRLGFRVDEDDDARPDPLDHRLVGYRQAVGELHDHLGAPGLGRMEAGVEVVDRAGRGDERFCRVRRGLPRVGEGCGRCLELIEAADPFLVGDDHEEDIPPLLAPADRLNADARGGFGELAEIAVDLGGVRELAGGPDDMAEVLCRRGHGVGSGHVGDPGVAEARLGRELGDRLDGAFFGLIRGVGILVLSGRGDDQRGAEKGEKEPGTMGRFFHGRSISPPLEKSQPLESPE